MPTPTNPLQDQQLPTQLSPQVLATLFPQQAATAAAPAAQPTAAPAAQPLDFEQEVARTTRSGRELMERAAPRAEVAGAQMQGLQQQYANAPFVKRSWLDRDPASGPAPGGFLHNLGRALIAIGGATLPGRAIQAQQYGPGVERWEATYGPKGTIAEQIAATQERMKGETELAQAGAGAVAKPLQALGREKVGEAAISKADSYAQKVQNDLTVALKGLDLKAISTGSQAALNAARAKFLDVKTKYEPERVAIAKEGVELGAQTRQAIANAMIAAGIQKDHPVFSVLDSVFGTAITPAAPQTTTGLTGPGATVPPKKAAAAPKGTVSYREGSTTYNIPAGMENEFKKDHPNAKRQ